MKTIVQSAILLAAGLGTRLRPLTLTIPKPLLPLNGELLLDHQLKYLAQAGIFEVAINLHHLGDKIREHAGDGKKYGLKISYSIEPEILGTGGGVKKAAALLKDGPFVVINCDALIDADIRALIVHHLRIGAAATMVLKELAKGDDYNPVEVDKTGFIRGFGRGRYFYAGLQVVDQKLLDALPPSGTSSCLIRDGCMKLIAAGEKVSSFIYDGYFNDIGTPERYEKARKEAASGCHSLSPCGRGSGRGG